MRAVHTPKPHRFAWSVLTVVLELPIWSGVARSWWTGSREESGQKGAHRRALRSRCGLSCRRCLGTGWSWVLGTVRWCSYRSFDPLSIGWEPVKKWQQQDYLIWERRPEIARLGTYFLHWLDQRLRLHPSERLGTTLHAVWMLFKFFILSITNTLFATAFL